MHATARRRPARLPARLALASGLALGACGAGGGADAPAYPADTVLAVGGRPIARAEVERAVERVRLVYPRRSREFLVASALESFVLPQAALRRAFPAEREAARARCEAAWAAVQAGDAPEAEVREGGYAELTLFLWDAARRLEPGAWSGPLERIGSFSIVQLVDRTGFENRELEERFAVRLLDFGYLPPDFGPPDLEAALAGARLEVVDPDYEELVPETYRYRMKGDDTP